MALSNSVTTTSSVSWRVKDTSTSDSNRFFDDQGQFIFSKNFSDGSGALGEVNQKWHNKWTLSSGEDTTLDLTSLSTTLFSTSITQSFTGIKDFLLLNNSTGVNYKVSVAATGSNGFTNLFNGESGNLVIYPNSVMHYTAWTSGWNVTADNKELTVRDIGGQGAEVSMFLAGTSGI